MNKVERISILIIAVLSVAIVVGVAADLFLGQNQHQSTSTSITSNSFIEEPVVDLIVPQLFRQTSTGGINAPLNVTDGENVSLIVEIYPAAVSVNVSMEYRSFFLSGTNASNDNAGPFAVTFKPEFLSIARGKEGNTTVNLAVSAASPPGDYNLIISAVDVQNSSYVWGVIVPVSIQ